MKPSMLKPGDRVRRIGSDLVLAFVKRQPRHRDQPARCTFQCDAWRGVTPDGTVTADDADVARHYELIAH